MMTQQRGEWNGLALLAGGFLLVIASVGGFFLGALVDRWLDTAPHGAIAGLVVGTVLGFWQLFVLAQRIMRQQPAPKHPRTWEEEEENFPDDEGVRD